MLVVIAQSLRCQLVKNCIAFHACSSLWYEDNIVLSESVEGAMNVIAIFVGSAFSMIIN
jgi:hypothetical protein